MLVIDETYSFIKVKIPPFQVRLAANPIGGVGALPLVKFEVILFKEGVKITLMETSISGESDQTFTTPALSHNYTSVNIGDRIGVYVKATIERRTPTGGSSVTVAIQNAKVAFSTTKIV